MSAILISSSPPPVFARSPTPVRSSSPSLPSPGALLRGDNDGSRRFKTAKVYRDSFSTGFTSARTLLGTKNSAENIPIRSPGKEKFKTTSSLSRGNSFITNLEAAGRVEGQPGHPPIFSLGNINEDDLQSGQTLIASSINQTVDKVTLRQPSEPEHPTSSDKENSGAPVICTKALPRRMDWTPAKDNNYSPLDLPDSPTGHKLPFNGGLLDNFGYGGPSITEIVVKRAEDGEPTKRRKLEIANTAQLSRFMEDNNKPQACSGPLRRKPSAKRKSSPTKKALTITALATAQYVGKPAPHDDTTITHYLEPTQITGTISEEKKGSAKVPKPRAKKPKPVQGRVLRSRLLSPQSAMKSFEQQEAFFGSASQLAREDSPDFVQKNKPASRQPPLMSDPVSTQLTQPNSIESNTPRVTRGTSRYVKTRNLWSVAGRDEDNALLHVDTVDLLDTPAVRLAFAGKDVLLEPSHDHISTLRPECNETPSILLQGIISPFVQYGDEIPYDVDSVVTPHTVHKSVTGPLSFQRSYHTSPTLPVNVNPSGKSADLPSNVDQTPDNSITKPAKTTKAKKRATPKKPSYAGLSVHDLQKQISAYGFKPVKKREKMIELLERCWIEKNGQVVEAVESEKEEGPKHGDFLGRVHDISNRPEPKVKKPRKKAAAGVKKTPTKEPKPRKKAEPKTKASKTTKTTAKEPKAVKTPRKRKAKIEDLAGQAAAEDSTVNERVKLQNEVENESLVQEENSAKPICEESIRTDQSENICVTQTGQEELTPGKAKLIDEIGKKIREAIMHESKHSSNIDRDHVRNPTWHEKILLYDPIILEDLTTWLNTSGMSLINEDREVSALEVRAWCESNGVCCLWRGGWRGNKGKKKDD